MTEDNNGVKMTCWTDAGDGDYRQSGALVATLPAGAYTFDTNMYGAVTADRAELPDEPAVDVGGPMADALDEIRAFWGARDRYAALALPYKRGLLLAGSHGTGKSATVRAVCREAIRLGGIVSLTRSLGEMVDVLPMLAEQEDGRLLVVVLEDIEQHFPRNEEELLELTDGESTVPVGTLFLATTNKLDAIPDRVKGRRSRFDRVIEFGAPTAGERRAYLASLLGGGPDEAVEAMVLASAGLPMSDVKELVIQVRIHGRDPEAAAARLRAAPTP
jgi:Cdc6-like AAA superfamily ATPase